MLKILPCLPGVEFDCVGSYGKQEVKWTCCEKVNKAKKFNLPLNQPACAITHPQR